MNEFRPVSSSRKARGPFLLDPNLLPETVRDRHRPEWGLDRRHVRRDRVHLSPATGLADVVVRHDRVMLDVANDTLDVIQHKLFIANRRGDGIWTRIRWI